MQELWHKHIWKITFVICLPLISAWAFADEIVGYTEHGTPVYESELQTKPTEVTKRIKIPKHRIRGYDSVNNNTIIINTREKGNKKHYEVKLVGCFNIDWSHQIIFDSWSTFYVTTGDKISYTPYVLRSPRSHFYNNWCTITSIKEVIVEESK